MRIFSLTPVTASGKLGRCSRHTVLRDGTDHTVQFHTLWVRGKSFHRKSMCCAGKTKESFLDEYDSIHDSTQEYSRTMNVHADRYCICTYPSPSKEYP